MKIMMRGLTLAAVLLTGAVTQAELVIDAFDTGGAVQNANSSQSVASGNRFFSKFGAVTTANMATLGSARINFGAAAASRFGQFVYTFTSNQDLHSTVGQYAVRFNFNAVGNFDLLVTASDTGANTAELLFSGLSGTGGIGFTGADFGNGAVLSDVGSLTFNVLETSDVANRSFTFTSAITAVPEPATMSLLGLTAIGGIFAHRRRKNQLAA